MSMSSLVDEQSEQIDKSSNRQIIQHSGLTKSTF